MKKGNYKNVKKSLILVANAFLAWGIIWLSMNALIGKGSLQTAAMIFFLLSAPAAFGCYFVKVVTDQTNKEDK